MMTRKHRKLAAGILLAGAALVAGGLFLYGLQGSAIVRFVSGTPDDAGPCLAHWPAEVARVVVLADLEARRPLGYYELHAGGSVVLDLEAIGKTSAVLKVLAGTVEIQGLGVGRFRASKGDTCTITTGQIAPTVGTAAGERLQATDECEAPPRVDQAEPEKADADRLQAYTATIRSLTERLAQAEQTRDAAQAEATTKTNLAREAADNARGAGRLAAELAAELLNRPSAEQAANERRRATDEEGRLRAELDAERMRSAEDCRALRRALVRVQHLVEEARNERNAAEQEAKRLAACLEGARATSDAWRGQAKAGDAAVQILRSIEVARTIETLQAEIDRLRAEVDRRRSK